MTSTNHSTQVYVGVCLCFLLSGFAALLYQTAWMRQFSTVFGTSELAVATVLSAYMGGLALGAALAGRFIQKVTRPVLTYGVLEAAIAISALLVPVFMTLANGTYVAILGGQASPPDASGLGQSVFYFCVAFLVLALPTTCMGATLPLLTRYAVTRKEQIGSRVGSLYAINTVGAVAGTVTAAFILLPAFGLLGTIWTGVVVNAVVFVIAAVIAKNKTDHIQEDIQGESEPVKHTSRKNLFTRSGVILPVMLLSGTASFIYEVLWTRLLSHILGGSVTAFAVMLASFLSGIALGSAVAARFAVTSERSVKLFIGVQAGIALTSMAIYHWLHLAIPVEKGLHGNVFVAISILLPATLFIGATFPLAVRIYTHTVEQTARSSAQVYAWNTVGAIVGAAFAGFILIPAVKYEGAIKIAVLTNIFLGLILALSYPTLRKRLGSVMTLVFVGLIITYQPAMPERILRVSPIEESTGGEILYYDVGRSSTVLMVREKGTVGIRNNGLPEAGNELKGSPPARFTQTMLTTLPGILRPDAGSMLIIGLGGGNAINGVPPSVKEIDVIELEPKVIVANRLAGPLRDQDPLLDPRVSMYVNDARSALSLTSKKYDAIISQPSHPWTAGASHLYTREFMSLAADHLTDEGVFLQWMGAQFIDESLLRSLCATMLEVFDQVRVYHMFGEVLFFVGSQSPMAAEYILAETGRPVIDAPVFYYHQGIATSEDLLAALALDTAGVRAMAKGAALITDNHNLMATHSIIDPGSKDRLNVVELGELFKPYMPVLDPNGWVHRDMHNANFAYISKRFEDMKLKRLGLALAESLTQAGNDQALLITGIGLQNQGDVEEGQRVLQEVIDADPQNNLAIYAMLQPWLNALARDQAPLGITALRKTLTGPAAAVMDGMKAVVNKDWRTVAALDPYLAQSQPTDPWFVDATRLMVEWRNNLAGLEGRNELAEQAWQILDLAIALHPVANLYAMRVSAAYLADRPDEVLETARRMAYILDSDLDVLEEQGSSVNTDFLKLKQSQIEAILKAVQDVAGRHDLSEQSLNEVIALFEALQQKTQ